MTYDWEADAKGCYDEAIRAKRAEWLVDNIPGVKRARVIGRCELLQGDCLEILPHLDRVDAVVTDPPYGLEGASTEKNNYESFDDSPAVVKRLVDGVLNSGIWDRMIMTPGQRMMFQYREPSAIGVFYYPAGTGSCSWGFVGWQPIFYYGKDPLLQDGKGRGPNCFVSSEAAEKNGHPCPKPINQWTRLVKRATRSADTILDPFAGSGTTLVACAKLGRRGIGIELDEAYFDIACKRVEDAYRQPDLLVDYAPRANPVQEGFDL